MIIIIKLSDFPDWKMFKKEKNQGVTNFEMITLFHNLKFILYIFY